MSLFNPILGNVSDGKVISLKIRGKTRDYGKEGEDIKTDVGIIFVGDIDGEVMILEVDEVDVDVRIQLSKAVPSEFGIR